MRMAHTPHVDRRRRSRPAVQRLAVLAVITASLAACDSPGQPGVSEGSAIQAPAASVSKMHAAPGDEWVTQTAFLTNISSEPIIIKSIELMPDSSGAEGLAIKSIEMAPLPRDGSPTICRSLLMRTRRHGTRRRRFSSRLCESRLRA